MDSAAAIYPGPDAAFFSAFHSPVTVDHRVVRVTSVIVFFMALFAGALAGHSQVKWLVSGSTKQKQKMSMSATGQVLLQCGGGWGQGVINWLFCRNWDHYLVDQPSLRSLGLPAKTLFLKKE